MDSISYCTATHPMQPNTSGHARGRKLHIVKDDTHTLYNMLIDEVVAGSKLNHYESNGRCKMCFQKQMTDISEQQEALRMLGHVVEEEDSEDNSLLDLLEQTIEEWKMLHKKPEAPIITEKKD